MHNTIYPTFVGRIRVENPLWLAPLAGISIPAYRRFHRRLGAGLVHTEMVSTTGLVKGNTKTRHLLAFKDEERPIVLQLFGSDPVELQEAAHLALSLYSFDGLEINMACPMPKILKKGAGARLLETPFLAKEMVSSLNVLGLPVWVKLRKLPGESLFSTTGFCELLLEAGADLLILHGRTPAQRYEGLSDRLTLKEAAASFPGKVAATGDVYTPSDVEAYLEMGCVGVLAARGTLKDVYLIPKTLYQLGFIKEDFWKDPSPSIQLEALIRLGNEIALEEGEKTALVMIRRMLSGTFKGIPGASQFRQKAAQTRNWKELLHWMQSIYF